MAFICRQICFNNFLCPSSLSSPLCVADHAQPHARVSECTLHLWVSIQTSLSLHALGTLHPCLLSSWVWMDYITVFQYVHFWRLREYSALSSIYMLTLTFFLCLSQEANTSLVRACWNELFTLGLAQCAHIMNLSTILTAIINHLQSSIQDGMDLRTSQKNRTLRHVICVQSCNNFLSIEDYGKRLSVIASFTWQHLWNWTLLIRWLWNQWKIGCTTLMSPIPVIHIWAADGATSLCIGPCIFWWWHHVFCCFSNSLSWIDTA